MNSMACHFSYHQILTILGCYEQSLTSQCLLSICIWMMDRYEAIDIITLILHESYILKILL